MGQGSRLGLCRPIIVSVPGIVVALTCGFLCGCGGGSSGGSSSQAGPTAAIAISIYPSTAISLNSGETQQFSAYVSGSSNINVIWSCSSGGAISQSGLFTAAAAGVITITATSNADSTKSATTTVTVTNPDADSILAEDSDRIVIMHPDGSGRRYLASGATPRWMSDHWHFTYFTHGVQPGPGLILTTPDGSNSSVIWNGEGYDAALSPDMSRIAFAARVSAPPSPGAYLILNVTNLSDGTTFQILKILCHVFCEFEKPTKPNWSPDGNWVVYSLGYDFSVHKVKADGTGDQRLYSLPGTFSPYYGLSYIAPVNPSLTHDGNFVLFDVDFVVDLSQPSTDTIYLVNASGSSDAVSITAGSQASASPDGKRIVFVGPLGLSTCNFDGTDVAAIGSGKAPNW